LSRPLNANALQTNRYAALIRAVVEQRRLFWRTYQTARQHARLQPPVGIEFAKLCNGLLNHTPAHTNTLYQPPISMRLAVFLSRGVSQVRVAYHNRSRDKNQRPKSALHAAFSSKTPTSA